VARIVLISRVMLRKVLVSGAIGFALLTATVRLPAAPCIVTNTASERACLPGCCANKACCATSHQRTGPPTQPLAKTTAAQQDIATIAPAIVVPLAIQLTAESHSYANVESASASRPRLALLCTFLI
jgi:hypothetical protein